MSSDLRPRTPDFILNQNYHTMNRKNFIRRSTLVFSALFAANWGTRAAIRAFKDPQKPLLTEKTLTHVMSAEGSRDRFPAILDAAIADPKKALQDNFSISPAQQRVIDAVKEAEWKTISQIFTNAKNANGRLNFKFTAVADQGGCEKFDVKALNVRGNLTKKITVTPQTEVGY